MGVPLGYLLSPFLAIRQNSAKGPQLCIPLSVTDQIKLYAIWVLHVLVMCLHNGIDEI